MSHLHEESLNGGLAVPLSVCLEAWTHLCDDPAYQDAQAREAIEHAAKYGTEEQQAREAAEYEAWEREQCPACFNVTTGGTVCPDCQREREWEMCGPVSRIAAPINDLPGGWEPALTATVPAGPDYDPGDPFAE